MNQIKDKFDLKLDEMLFRLKDCQENLSQQSCLNCEKFIDCETRNDYVKAVYESMSKGKKGGFEF
ncbi:hypothetical protein F1B92_02300 [Campylobacter sp. FMV-PI01]|uniref:Uncharacterized protein n=1 Tax=Campylobacter portucalensis TaxID=2608384 RepID=A0A6L5WJL3_9BACT|nr:hypothetical protein [Campylobacter portucalensis]MSN96033.1 hypothetical protein [Campylobacter portucalensis]